MPMRMAATQLAGKVETVEGTKETLTLNECVLVKGAIFAPAVEMYQRDLLRGTMSRDPALSGQRSAKISFTMEMAGSGNKGVAPSWGPFMKGCGFNETISANNSVTYTPLTNNMTNSMTLATYQDGVIKRMWGARGNVKITIEAGKPGLLDFAFEGCDWELVDGALLAPTYPTIVPPVFMNSSLTVDSYAAILAKVELDVANTLQKRESINSVSGFLSTLITGRNPKGSMDPELVTKATYDFYGKMQTPGTLGSLTMSANGATGNIVTITCPKVRYVNITDQDRGGLRTLGLDFAPCVNSADDEISIVLT
jgi:hypothetical protein